MAKVSFNAKPEGITVGTHHGNVGGPASGCAYVPVMGRFAGIEAIMEGLRLADIECSPPANGGGGLTDDVDS